MYLFDNPKTCDLFRKCIVSHPLKMQSLLEDEINAGKYFNGKIEGVKFMFNDKESVKITLMWYWAENAKVEDVLDMIHRFPISPAFDKDSVMGLCQEYGDIPCNTHGRQWIENQRSKSYQEVWPYDNQQTTDKKPNFGNDTIAHLGDKRRLLNFLEEKNKCKSPE